MSVERHDVVVIGAGFVGLGLGAALRARAVDDFVILEQGADVGHFWSTTYDRLRLHSPWHGIAHDRDVNRRYSMFKSRDQVIDFCRAYAQHKGLYAHLHFGRRVSRLAHVEPAEGGADWRIETNNGTYAARYVAVATAINRLPQRPRVDGESDYRGQVLHSVAYRNPAPFVGRDVLVVGSGNSAAEIALDLAEHGAGRVALWVRGPRHFIPVSVMRRLYRLFGLLGLLSQRRVDAAHRMPYGVPEFWKVVRGRDAVVGRFSPDLARYGIRKPSVGPQEELFRHGRIPTFDVGALPLIRAGRIEVIDGTERPIDRFTPGGVRLGAREEAFDRVIFATGFQPGLEQFVADRELLGPVRWWASAPLTDGRSRSRVHPSAFFPGFDVSANGGLSLGLWGWEAGERIADALGTS